MGFRQFFEILLGLNDTTLPAPATDMQRWQNALSSGASQRRSGQYEQALEIFETVLQEARQAENMIAEATALGHIGAVYTDQKQWDEAEHVLRQAVAIAREQQNPILLAAVLNDWGDYLLATGKVQEAEDGYSEALTQARQGTDPSLTAHILGKLADRYLNQDNASYARRLLEEANQLTRFQVPDLVGQYGMATIDIGHEADGHRWVVQALRLSHAVGSAESEIRWATALADRYASDGKLVEANRLYQRVAVLLSKGNAIDAEMRARFLLARAEVSMKVGKPEEAIGFAEEGIPLAEDLGLMQEVARAHGVLGAAYRANGQTDLAVGHLQTALSYVASDAPPSELLDLQLELARAQQAHNENDALETYQIAEARARETGSDAQLAVVLMQEGRLAYSRGNASEALDLWRQAARLFEDQGDADHLAPLLCDIANLLKDQGDRKQALTLYEHALVALNNVEEPQTRGVVLSNVANMYTDTGDIETAQAFYDESIAIAHDTSDHAAESLRLGNLGWFYIVTGRYRQAVDTLEKALKLSSQSGAPLMEAVQRDNLGQAYARLGDFDAALSLHRQAVSMAAEHEEARWQAVFQSNLGETLFRKGAHDDARREYDVSLVASRAQNDDAAVARTLWRLGDQQRAVGEFEGASANYDEAISIARRIGAQRDLALAYLGKGLLAQAQEQAEQARKALTEAQRLLQVLHAPEREIADNAIKLVG